MIHKGRVPYQLVLLTLVLVLGGVLRYAYNSVTVNQGTIQADARSYTIYASNIVDHGTFSKDLNNPPVPDSYWAPGYPGFLAILLTLGERLEVSPYNVTLWAQLILGVLTILLTYLIASSFLPGLWALLPALLVALSPHLIAIGHNVLTETLFCFLIALSICLFIHGVGRGSLALTAAAGASTALAWLVNPVSLFMAPLMALVILVSAKPGASLQKRTKVVMALLLVLPLVLAMSAWTVRSALNVPAGAPDSSGRLLTNMIIGMHSDFHEKWRADKRNPNNPDIVDRRRIEGSYRKFLQVWTEKFRNEPGAMIRWYLLSKPIELWDWEVKVGFTDIYIYPIKQSLYHRSTWALASYKVMQFIHYYLVAAAALGVLLILFDDRETRWIPQGIYLISIYICLVYVATQADPRYSFPLRPEMYVAATYAIYRLARLMYFDRRGGTRRLPRRGVSSEKTIAYADVPD